jgi:hypothetical protein
MDPGFRRGDDESWRGRLVLVAGTKPCGVVLATTFNKRVTSKRILLRWEEG